MEKAELVFIPGPGTGHLVPIVEFAKELLRRDNRFSVSLLLISSPFENDSLPLPTNISDSQLHIRFFHVPKPLQLPPLELSQESIENYLYLYIKSHKSQVKDIIVNRFAPTTSFRLAGLVVDMFCSSMNDVARELEVPSYLFFPSGAGFLGFTLFVHSRQELHRAEFEESDPESHIPSYANPVRAKALPSFAFSKQGGFAAFAALAREFKKTKGIIINTVLEFESHAVGSLSDGVTPPVYTVGPLLDFKGESQPQSDQLKCEHIMMWLNDQPPKSVVFLCFGSEGYFGEAQLREIAIGLERSGQRFLWSVRKAPTNGRTLPEDHTEITHLLPLGFWEKTKEIGRVCGWAPQVQVLSHRAIGGFVSHCGWNSILESMWYGVPIATWPMYAEQQLNAFQLTRDLELAVELRIDYRLGSDDDIVSGAELERAIRCLMDGGDGNLVRKKVQMMSEKCRRAFSEGGSSYESFRRLKETILGCQFPIKAPIKAFFPFISRLHLRHRIP